MNVRARLYPPNVEGERALSARLGTSPPEPRSGRYPVDLDGPVLGMILEDGERTGGFRVSGETLMTAGELKAVSHFQLASASMVVETEDDFTANDAVRAATPLRDAGGAEPIRLMRGLTLSRIRLKPNQAGTVGDWTSEYVLGSAFGRALTDTRLTGFTLDPLLDGGGDAHGGFRHLHCEKILPPAVIDASVERVPSDTPGVDALRHLGNLCYEAEALVDRPDFNRTAEPWDGWHGWPAWVVSSRVREVYAERSLRGWRFRPVLVRGSEAYETYREGWALLRALVEAHPSSSFDGARW